MMHQDSAGYTFAGLWIGVFISLALEYEGFGIESPMSSFLSTIGANYHGKSKAEKPK